MRIWHYKLIPFLPKSQLLAQWRELNNIFKKQDKHILINYVYEYPKDDLCIYANMVKGEMYKRGYKVNSMENYKSYFKELPTFCDNPYTPFKNHHNNEYLAICYFNLKEKYIRGQKDFDIVTWNLLVTYVNNHLLEEIM